MTDPFTTVRGTATHANLLPTVELWVSQALKEHAATDKVVWSVVFQAVPSSELADDLSSLPGWLPLVVLYLELELEETDENALYAIALLQPYRLTKGQVDEVVSTNITQLRIRRAALPSK